MIYMGSKRRIAKYILPIILSGRTEKQWYVEPFVGGANMIENVDGNRLGADINYYLIEALKMIQQNLNEIPKNENEWNEKDYKLAKKNINCSPGLRGYCGFQLSYGGKWFSGWKKDNIGKRKFITEGYKNAVKQSAKIQNVKFVCCNYLNLKIPEKSIIYCDPPYKKTGTYKNKFNHYKFWRWCRNKTKQGHTVFISEYNAPKDFICVWQKEIYSSLAKNTGKTKGLEKLFVYQG